MPFGRTVSIGRGSFTFKTSVETGARFSRSTLLVGMDLSWAGSPWLHPETADVAARMTAAAACAEKRKLILRLIDFLTAFTRRIPRRLYRAAPLCPFGLVHTTVRPEAPRYSRATRWMSAGVISLYFARMELIRSGSRKYTAYSPMVRARLMVLVMDSACCKRS